MSVLKLTQSPAMEIHFPLVLFTTLLLLVVVVMMIKRVTSQNSKNMNLPPGPPKLPIIGNLHQLLGRLPHHALRDLAQKYGPDLMHLKLGEVDHIFVSSFEGAKEIIQNYDLNFASRPQLLTPKIVFYDCTDIAFSPYGKYLSELRKICTAELLSATRVRALASLRKIQISNLVDYISSASTTGTPINLTEKLSECTSTGIARTAFGAECAQTERFVTAMRKVLKYFNGLNVSDVFPTLRVVDVLSGMSSSLKKIHREVDGILSSIIEEHQINRAHAAKDEEDHDLLDVLLRIQENGINNEVPLTMDNVKAVVLDMFLGGTETTAQTLVWAMTELMRQPALMKKVQTEVRQALKGKTEIDGDDVENIRYVKLVMKETLRLHPIAPLLLPRICRESCQVMGYDIPEGSRLLINVWAIARDPKHWDDAETFKPERFDGSRVDFRGNNFEYLPFGGGRRRCPGMTYGVANVELVLAHLLFYFNWELPKGMRPCDLDMTEIVGTVACRKSSLCLLAKPYM